MKLERLFISIFFVPCLLCQAQAQEPADKPGQAAAQAVPTEAPAAQAPAVQAPVAQAPAATVQDAPPLAAGAASDTYVIGPTDTIVVSVWKEGALSGNLMVRPDGMISMPLLGDVQASGFTCLQLADQIQNKLKKFVQDPQVSVVLTQIRSKTIYILGEIGKKGPIEMTPDMTLLQAIAIAGGLSDFANVKKIYILRNEGGTHQKIHVHYKQALKGDSSVNLLLKPGDTIVVP